MKQTTNSIMDEDASPCPSADGGGKMKLKTQLLIAGALLIGLVTGLLIGRAYPARHYEPWGPYLLDKSNGKLCTPVRGKPQPVAQVGPATSPGSTTPPKDFFDQVLGSDAGANKISPPYCGEE